MSHFLTLVLVDSSEAAPADVAEMQMRRYFAPDMFGVADAKCDGFTVGGRYDGLIWGKEQHYNLAPAAFQARYGFDVVQPADNIRPVADLPSEVLAYAIITPDGAWHDREGKSDGEWQSEWAALQRRYHDQIAVAIDCHC